MRLWAALAIVLVFVGTAAADEVPPGPFTQAECVACHEQESPDIVSAWRQGPHARADEPVLCTTCHGDLHAGSSERARPNGACLDCHGGPKGSLARSYLTSKHGVIATLEAPRWDWSEPLSSAGYRAPTCAYCHMHEGGHGAGTPEDMEAACIDCHSLRFVRTTFDAARGALEIGRLKVREAREAVVGAEGLDLAAREALGAKVARMEGETLGALRAGLAHHSPDYQWWYGQAALDGDLIRIKAAIMRALRRGGPGS